MQKKLLKKALIDSLNSENISLELTFENPRRQRKSNENIQTETDKIHEK